MLLFGTTSSLRSAGPTAVDAEVMLASSVPYPFLWGIASRRMQTLTLVSVFVKLMTTFWLQLWSSIAEHLAQEAPDVMVLVHPLDMRLESSEQKQRIVKGKQPGLSDVMTGVTAHRLHKLYARHRLESLMRSGVATTEFSGRVGEECCDDEVYSQVSSFSMVSCA